MKKIKNMVSGAAALSMLVCSMVSVNAQVNVVDNSSIDKTLDDTTKKVAAADYYTDKDHNTLGDLGWTLPQDYTFDDDKYHFLGFTEDLTLGNGYGAGDDWAAITFNMTVNSNGDYAVFDCDGKGIYGDCYAPQTTRRGTDYYWGGHGERSYGGIIADDYGTNGVNRFSNYLKTEVTKVSVEETTVKLNYNNNAKGIICTKLIENKNGDVTDLAESVKAKYTDGTYSGEYYTVKTYSNDDLIGIDYYSGHFNGIKTIKDKVKNYYGNLTIYSGKNEELPSFETEVKNIGASYGKDAENNEDQNSKATGFLTTVTGTGAFDSITWNVTSGDKDDTFTVKELGVTLEESSSCYFGLIIEGLHDASASATAVVK